MAVLLLSTHGVKDVKEEDLLIEFKVIEVQEPKNEVEVKRELDREEIYSKRVNEAHNFWKAFFAAHSKGINKDALKGNR